MLSREFNHGHASNSVVIDKASADKSLLIVEDDNVFLKRLARAMTCRGFSVETAATRADAIALIRNRPPLYGIIDLRLTDGSGLDVIEAVRMRRDDSRLLILTGYGNIANAVTAVKLGAIDYLAKPVDTDEVVRALTGEDDVKADPPEHPMSAARVRWEYIQRVYERCEQNISETARHLNMHRRTLQRILSKHAPK